MAGARDLPTGANSERSAFSTAVLTKSCAKCNPARLRQRTHYLEVSKPWKSVSPVESFLRDSRMENCRSLSVSNDGPARLFLHTWCSSLLSNVYIPRLLLDLSSAPLSFASLARFVPLSRKRRCFREGCQRQVFSCLSADKSEDCHAKKTSNPVR
jgi:hypothetical protein